MIEEPEADTETEPLSRCSSTLRRLSVQGRTVVGSIFSVTSYRKSRMKFLANPIISFVSTNLKQL